MRLTELDTPCVVIDEDKVEANLAGFQRHCDTLGVALRPHIKTHKLPELARRQLELGAKGITCQKIGEAEVFAAAGFDDILITFNIVGPAKLERLAALAARVERLCVVADSATVVEGLAGCFDRPERPLGVMVECDTGAGRCGVQSAEAALELARRIEAAPGLRFAGLMTYPKAFNEAQVQAWFSRAQALFDQAGIAIPTFSSGGTPSMWKLAEAPIVTEYRIGTYAYQDRSQVAAGACRLDDCALAVMTTVVSCPTPDRVVVDAGSKALTSDLLGLEGYGCVLGHPEARVVGLSEEHGTLDFSACAERPAVGDLLSIVPNHACPVSNLFDQVHFHRAGLLTRSLPVAARGKVG
ncbi:D-TA family PLP-dependent enzyme [Halotalea alkalilenta]|uniref:Alanine racemase n=1 Tax=Halotalea alkalilenta TaxID=376489 RepID=A0A172YG23_9GAMM|nr:D-TA family PLP-dependent enzyme [Halotalea alkalilenta]ANF58147.1 alanine racemase [Halotalea alkalilenta]